MKILFLGDVVGTSGCSKIKSHLLNQIKIRKIDFVIVNAENAAETGFGLTKEICEDFFKCGVNVITTGNHVCDQKGIIVLSIKKIDCFDQKIYLNLHLGKALVFILLLKIKK